MTTLAKISGGRAATPERVAAAPRDAIHALVARLQEESERQVPFSQAKLLFREAAAAIARLEGELARVAAELATERAARLP